MFKPTCEQVQLSIVPQSAFRHGLNKVIEERRLNNRYPWFKHGLDDDFHKRCLNLV